MEKNFQVHLDGICPTVFNNTYNIVFFVCKEAINNKTLLV